MTSEEDDLIGKQPLGKINSQEDDLMGRQPEDHNNITLSMNITELGPAQS